MNNVSLFQNFRSKESKEIEFTLSEKLNIVFMARINKMKGIDMIFELGDYIMKSNLIDKIKISFYGPVYKEDKSYFFDNIKKYPFMKYHGILEVDQIDYTLRPYDIMLLPTHYFTEGLPGSIVDAYFSGLPVVVTKWKYSKEFVDHGKTGIIIPFENGQDELNCCVKEFINNKDSLLLMKRHALDKSKDYSYSIAMNRLKAILSL